MLKVFTWAGAFLLATLAVLFALLAYTMWPAGVEPVSVAWEECVTPSAPEPVHYTVVGELSDDIDPAVFIHGRGSSALEFTRLAELLASEGLPSVLVNLRGHGPSQMPRTPDKGVWQLKALADDVHYVVTECAGSDRYHTFGASFGGVVALELTKRHMDAVSSLVTFGTHLEVESTPNQLIGLDRSTLSLPEWAYNAYQAAAWCHFDRYAYQALMRARGAFNPTRDLVILDQISPQDPSGEYKRYDYRGMLEDYERQGGRVSMVVGESDWLINGGLGESLVFMDEPGDRQVLQIPGGHYAHLADPGPLADALFQILLP